MISVMSAVPTRSDDPQGVWLLNVRCQPHQSAWQPPTDVFETEEAIVVRMEIAGMRAEDFHLRLDGQILLIQGHRDDPDLGRAYHRLEIPFGTFQVAVALPKAIDEQHVEAEYRDGFLRIYLPKQSPHALIIHSH